MTPKNSIDDNDALMMAAATGNPPPSTGQHPHLRSDGSPPGTLVWDVQGMARPHVPPPPPAPDESNILSNDEGSSPLLSDPDDVDFQVVVAGCRQRVTPLQDASPTMAETLPPTTGNSFGTLADTNDSPPQAYDALGEQAADSDDALYKAVCASQPDITAILLWQDNTINATMTQMTTALNLLVDRMEAMEDRLLAKIDAFNGQFGNLRCDVNDHDKHLTNLSSDLCKQESLLKGYKDKKDKLVVTLRTDINGACAKIPALRRELQDSPVGLATSIKEIEAIVQDLRAQVATLPQVDQGTEPSPPPMGCFCLHSPNVRCDPFPVAWWLDAHLLRVGFLPPWQSFSSRCLLAARN
jgi:hypothetical protein